MGLEKSRMHKILTKDKSPVSEGEENHVRNEDEIDKSHKSQLKFKKPKLGF